MAGNKSPYRVLGVEYQVMATGKGYRETGIASWYGRKFHGRKTSNGEVFDVYRITAAHKSLPIPTYVRVTNLDNQTSIIARVNDRGPFHPDRIIDLSYAAAVKLGFAEKGTARVEVEHIDTVGVEDRRHSQLGGGGSHFLQVGAFQSEQTAEEVKQQLTRLTAEPVQVSALQTDAALWYRVRVGPAASETALLSLQKVLQAQGFGLAKLLIE